jgi:phosphate-selective porin OprO/OprP
MRRLLVAAGALGVWLAAGRAEAEDAGRDPNLDAGEADRAPRQKEDVWNEADLRVLTVRVGGGLLLDYANYIQDAASKDQMELAQAAKLRDFRFLFKGHFWFWPERLSYTLGYMYDGPTESFHFRQTGLILQVPELAGHLFVGRTKEGFSTNKIMVGYNGWTNERSAASDSFIPILADGIKWTGAAGDHFVYNAGVFMDEWSETESFNKNDNQAVARVVWLPLPKKSAPLLHFAVEARYGAANNGTLRFRSKPESFPAQSYAVDTGKFAADSSNMFGFEAYYRPGSLMFGSEYYLNKVTAPQFGDPLFTGGEVFASYLFTGEIHPYNTAGAFFEAVSPSHPMFKDGFGAVEAVVRYSQVDLNDARIAGGRFWRITPMINWYWSDNVRLEFVYGFSRLNRFGLEGDTQYFQGRIQFTLM